MCATAPFSVMSRRDDGETSRSECGREASGRRKATRPGRSWWFSCLQILISVHLKNRVHVHSTAGFVVEAFMMAHPLQHDRVWISLRMVRAHRVNEFHQGGSLRPVSGLLKKAGGSIARGWRRSSRHPTDQLRSSGNRPLLADSLFYASNAAADSPQNHEVASVEGIRSPAQAVHWLIPGVPAKCGMGRCSKRAVLAVDPEKLPDAISLAELQTFAAAPTSPPS